MAKMKAHQKRYQKQAASQGRRRQREKERLNLLARHPSTRHTGKITASVSGVDLPGVTEIRYE